MVSGASARRRRRPRACRCTSGGCGRRWPAGAATVGCVPRRAAMCCGSTPAGPICRCLGGWWPQDGGRAPTGGAGGPGALADGRARSAGVVLAEALALWRGPPLAEFGDQPFARELIPRLAELRLEAVEARIEADLMVGRDRELVAELESLVAAHPLRERPRAQLMLALYRSGRQADALAVYRQTRALLDT